VPAAQGGDQLPPDFFFMMSIASARRRSASAVRAFPVAGSDSSSACSFDRQ
jgi:hypothetical protein